MTAVGTQPACALATVAGEGAAFRLGLEDFEEGRWAVLAAAGVRLLGVADVADAMRALRTSPPRS